jgi:hypothetical protein
LEKGWWYNRFKSWEEAPPLMKVPKEDKLPIVISAIIGILILVIGIPLGLAIVKFFRR